MMCISCENAVSVDTVTDMTDTTDVDFPNLIMGGGPGSHGHILYLSFVDAKDNDLVEGLKGTEPEGSIEANFVAPDQYTLTSSPDLYELGYFSNPTTIYDNTHPYPRLGFMPSNFQNEWEDVWDEAYFKSKYKTEEEYNKWMKRSYDLWMEYRNARNGRNQLQIEMKSPTEDIGLETITYTLTCQHVFTDNAAHEIVTFWREPSTGPNYYSVCCKVVVDGKEFTDISYANHEQQSFATIVLDR